MGAIESKVAAQQTTTVTTVSRSSRTAYKQASLSRLGFTFLRKQNKTTPSESLELNHSNSHTVKALQTTTTHQTERHLRGHERVDPGDFSHGLTAQTITKPNSTFFHLGFDELSIQLLKAVKRGDQEIIERVNEAAAKKQLSILNVRGMWESTPLIYACQYCHEGVALWLIDEGADICLSNERGVTPLLLASLEGMGPVVERILQKLQDMRTCEGYVPIDNQVGIVYNSLIDLNVRATPMLAASMNGHEAVIRLLLEHGANVNCGLALDQSKMNGLGSCGERGADPKMLPILVAAKYGHASAIRVLMEHGANVDVTDGSGNHALHLVCETGNEECATAFLRSVSGASNERWKTPNNSGYTPLHYCAMKNLQGAVELMLVKLKWGIDCDFVNAKSMNRQETALILACRKKHFAVAKILLNNGADMMLQDRGGTSAFDLLKQQKRDELINLCTDQKGVLNLRDQLSWNVISPFPHLVSSTPEATGNILSHISGNQVGAFGEDRLGEQLETRGFNVYQNSRDQAITNTSSAKPQGCDMDKLDKTPTLTQESNHLSAIGNSSLDQCGKEDDSSEGRVISPKLTNHDMKQLPTVVANLSQARNQDLDVASNCCGCTEVEQSETKFVSTTSTTIGSNQSCRPTGAAISTSHTRAKMMSTDNLPPLICDDEVIEQTSGEKDSARSAEVGHFSEIRTSESTVATKSIAPLVEHRGMSGSTYINLSVATKAGSTQKIHPKSRKKKHSREKLSSPTASRPKHRTATLKLSGQNASHTLVEEA